MRKNRVLKILYYQTFDHLIINVIKYEIVRYKNTISTFESFINFGSSDKNFMINSTTNLSVYTKLKIAKNTTILVIMFFNFL